MKSGHRASRCTAGIPVLIVLFAIAGCSSKTELKPFTSDGCSLFPDSSVITGDDWCSCCLQHDLAYWRGGTELQRNRSDARLHNCVLEKTKDRALATLMYEGVKVGGSPYFYNWYRWGYGWGYDRKYQALTRSELARAVELEQQYRQSAQTGICRTEALPAASL